MSKIAILHPGEMGVSIAAAAIHGGHQLFWASHGRSEKSRARAENHGVTDLQSLAQICRTCELILSVCPTVAAEDVARSVIENGFQGLYLDANAIAPQRAIRIGSLMEEAGIGFVDGGIIGGPAWTPNETWLYLSGREAGVIAACFSNGPLGVRILGNEIGKASALKMCYAAYTKGTTALLAGVLATAETLDVREALYQQWNMDDSDFSTQVHQRVGRVTSKAWRFEGEMQEIAATFRAAGLPGGFHDAAGEIYHRLAGLKDRDIPPALDQILDAVTNKAT